MTYGSAGMELIDYEKTLIESDFTGIDGDLFSFLPDAKRGVYKIADEEDIYINGNTNSQGFLFL